MGLSQLAAKALKTRWLVRAPIWLYRARLGFLMTSRLLMLQHTGRMSGLPRRVVLEVAGRPDSRTFVVVSGFGTGAQWYRNVLAHPEVRVSTGFRVNLPARATPLTEPAAAVVLRRYQADHPQAWARLRSTIEEATGETVSTLPMVQIVLDGPGP